MDLMKSLEQFGRTTGEYWSKDNADFEKTNPTFTNRLIRTVNPMTSFGSALGAMHDAASNGFPLADTTAAILQSLPTFGSLRVISTPAQGAIKAAQTIKDQTLRNFLLGSLLSTGIDEAQAKEVK